MMETVSPKERQDRQIAVVMEELVEILSSIHLARWMEEPDVGDIEQAFMEKAHRLIVTGLDENLVVRAIVASVWKQAAIRAEGVLEEMGGDPGNYFSNGSAAA